VFSRSASDVAELWDAATVESLAARVERCGRAIAELGTRSEKSALAALELASALRAAGQALAFVDDDAAAVGVVIERLQQLERQADGLLTLWQDDETRQYSERLRWEARQPRDDETTRVMPRIVPPMSKLAGNRRAAR
jgi:hypothetical protein